MKSFLKLPDRCPTPSLHFLFSELPMEAKIHCDIFSLFFSIFTNATSKVSQIIKYLLENNIEKSKTWTAHLKYLCDLYHIGDPLDFYQDPLLQN